MWKLSCFGGTASSTKQHNISCAMALRNSRINAQKLPSRSAQFFMLQSASCNNNIVNYLNLTIRGVEVERLEVTYINKKKTVVFEEILLLNF